MYKVDFLVCKNCEEITKHFQKKPNFILYLILTIFTFGAWGVVWLFYSKKDSPWYCSVCQKKANASGWKKLGDIYRQAQKEDHQKNISFSREFPDF